MKQLLAAILCVVLCGTAAGAQPSAEQTGDELRSLGFAASAVRAYEEAIALSDPGDRARLGLKLAAARYALGEFDAALTVVTRFALAAEDRNVRASAELLRVRLQLRLEDYDNADSALAAAVAAPHERVAADVGFLHAFNPVNQGDFAQATRRFDAYIARSTSAWHREHAAATRSILVQTRAEARDPRTIAALSLLPGLGQATLGHWQEASAAFALNALLATMAHEAQRRSREIPRYGQSDALFWSALFLVFYTGNIYNAGELARQDAELEQRARRDAAAARGYMQIMAP